MSDRQDVRSERAQHEGNTPDVPQTSASTGAISRRTPLRNTAIGCAAS
ncbi:MAG TPA: hypothetical protein VH352_23165 [Pseudonocardiaceae bacterium]|jgi:hypothetical protein|nr:hypothetical protein [Pseudonocardiaceae bacterium]